MNVLAFSRISNGLNLILHEYDGKFRLALRQDLTVIDDSCVFSDEDAAYRAFEKAETRLEKESTSS